MNSAICARKSPYGRTQFGAKWTAQGTLMSHKILKKNVIGKSFENRDLHVFWTIRVPSVVHFAPHRVRSIGQKLTKSTLNAAAEECQHLRRD